MTRGRLIFFLLSLAVVLPLVSGGVLGEGEGRERGLYRNLSVFTEVLSLIRRAYVEEVDVEALMDGALDGTADALDAFSLFVPAEDVPSFLAAREIGIARSGMQVGKARGVAFVLALDEEGPAAKAGFEAGDVISQIDGRSTREIALWEIEVLLARDPETLVETEIIRRGETQEIAWTLADFEPTGPRLEDHEGISLLRIPRFSSKTGELVAELLEGFEGQALIIDLRRSALGEGRWAFDVGRLFVQGELGRLAARGEELEAFESKEAPIWQGHLVVLVDRATLGPGELLATILSQGGDAKVVGQSTFGYAGRQALFTLTNGARVQLTDAFYAGPDHEPILEGLEPDVKVSLRGRGLSTEEEPSLDTLILEEALKVLREEPDESQEEEREAA